MGFVPGTREAGVTAVVGAVGAVGTPPGPPPGRWRMVLGEAKWVILKALTRLPLGKGGRVKCPPR